MQPVIEARGLGRSYGSSVALAGVDFAVSPGEIVGLLGPNGAGKTTTMKLLSGWLAPTAGSATVCGCDVLTDPIGVQRQVGTLPEGAPAYDELTVAGWLRFAAEVRGLGAAERERALERVVADCGLDGRLDQAIGTLSRGYRQRVGLAQALLHQPRVLILDEPTTGLDPNQVAEVRALIRRVGETRTVLLSTHVLPEVQAVCDRVLILHEGRLVADDRVEVLSRSAGGQVLRVGLGPGKVQPDSERVVAELAALDGVRAVRPLADADARLAFEVTADGDVRAAVYGWAVEHGHVLVELSAEQRSLEEVFRHLTMGEPAHAG